VVVEHVVGVGIKSLEVEGREQFLDLSGSEGWNVLVST
jgi:hypothetical protein